MSATMFLILGVGHATPSLNDNDAVAFVQHQTIHAVVSSNGEVGVMPFELQPTTFTLAGCPNKRNSKKHPAEQTPLEGATAAVRCCFAHSNNRFKMKTYGFDGGDCQVKPYAEALELCKSLGDGKTLCTKEQLEASVTCGAGCGYDGERVWSLDESLPTFQRQASVTAVEPTTFTLAGCPKDLKKAPLEQTPLTGVTAAVRCCFADSNDKFKMNTYGFEGGDCQIKPYAEALELCKGLGDGKTLCTKDQLEAGVTCGTGCNYDRYRVWSLDESMPTTPTTKPTTKKPTTKPTTVKPTTQPTTEKPTTRPNVDPSSNGPGLDWVGINGGSLEYTDSRGRLWHRGLDKWTPAGWGGWVGDDGTDPREYTNSWGFQCSNWPLSYNRADVDALLQRYQKGDSQQTQVLRVNLQSPDQPITYYTATYQFCEKTNHGGKKMDILINGNLVKEDYTTKTHSTHTDIYKWKCIPTNGGSIDVEIRGKADGDFQSRFSTLEFEKSLGGCGECKMLECNLGTCAVEEAYDKTTGGSGRASVASVGDGVQMKDANKMKDETPTISEPICRCNAGVLGDHCEQGECALVDCNEPLGGSCSNNLCTCKNGYTGDGCQTPPNTDEFGCYAKSASALDGKLKVRTLCLPEKIAGPLMGNIYRGPTSIHAVGDRTQSGVAYFSWTSDRPYGNSTADGRVYVSKLSGLSVADGEPTLQGSAFFNGFVRSGGIDITETGTIGTLCAKYVPSWVQACVGGGDSIGNCPLALAVCEVNATTMTVKDTPWRIGKQYQRSGGGAETGIWGSYAIESWFAERSAGSGYLLYAPKSKQWTAWYGAMIGHHTGYAMHTYAHDAASLSEGTSGAYAHPLPSDQIAHRQETTGPKTEYPFADNSRRGTGDHQGGAAWHYHSGLGDIGLMKHTHGTVYMQQYGLVEPEGNFTPAGHSTGRVELTHDGDNAVLEGGLRQCGQDWILALVTEQNGNVCAKVSKKGVIQKWVSIEASVGKMPCSKSGSNCGDGRKGGLTRIAPLGAPEAKTCGSAARFLFGYEKEDRTRWLVEVDGDCEAKESSREDVTQHTTWPTNQDWTTTADGAVVWVTSWTLDGAGKFGPEGSPNSVDTYPSPIQDGDAAAQYRYLRTTGATNEAKVTVYYPSSS